MLLSEQSSQWTPLVDQKVRGQLNPEITIFKGVKWIQSEGVVDNRIMEIATFGVSLHSNSETNVYATFIF